MHEAKFYKTVPPMLYGGYRPPQGVGLQDLLDEMILIRASVDVIRNQQDEHAQEYKDMQKLHQELEQLHKDIKRLTQLMCGIE